MLHLHRKKTCLISRLACSLRLALLFGFIFLSQVSPAQLYRQDLNLFDHDSKPYYFGLTIGINLARFHPYLHEKFLQDDSVYIAEPTNSGGLSLGLSATGRISDRFQVRFNPQLMFIERNIYYKLRFPDIDGNTEVTKKVESVIVSFPLELKFQSDRIGNFRVYMLGGVHADIDMASNARAKRAEELVKIEKYDWGPELGLGFNFFFESFIFSPEIKVVNGIRNIHARDKDLKFSNVFDKIQSRMIVFSIHIEG